MIAACRGFAWCRQASLERAFVSPLAPRDTFGARSWGKNERGCCKTATAKMPLIYRLFLLLALLSPLAAHAGIANAPGENLQVSLITYGPGDTYWERFGHDAIELRDARSGQAISFNYGVFDFNEKGFLLNFARGRMHYLMDAEPSAVEQPFYVQAGRSITTQRLAFDPQQAAALRDFLLWNLQPENAGYSYDYYLDNCSTRVRDALDKALGGALKKHFVTQPGGLTFRQQTARLMSNQPWLMLLLDLGLGPFADQPLNAWQESFLPMVLERELIGVTLADAQGKPRPLVVDQQVLSPNALEPPPAAPPDLRLPLACAGLLFAAVLLATQRFLPTAFALIGSLYLVLAATAGLLMLVLWFFTTHHSAWANANLLFFNPLAYALLASCWRMRAGVAPGRYAQGLLVLQLIGLLVALGLHLLPGLVQQNQPWLLLAMPVWLALAWSLRRGPRAA